MMPSTTDSERPKNVGILALEVYFPQEMVDQADLEAFDNVSSGKYTTGLGQSAMSFVSDQEDVISMSLTVVQLLLEKFSINPIQVGRLEVGTESSVDRSKSVKSHLMQLFEESGNSDILGVDCINACYGGTSAVLNAVNWVESRSWDGRNAIIVAADVAIYAAGPARPSGGCGAVAMLIGPDAPLVVEPVIASHMENVYDFYKPYGIFPQVDGQLSIKCYLQAIDRCYSLLCRKFDSRPGPDSGSVPDQPFSLASVAFCVMHAPFAKMLKKGFARLALRDCQKVRQTSNQHASTSTPSSFDQPASAAPGSGSQPAYAAPGSGSQPPQESQEGVGDPTSTAELRRVVEEAGEGVLEDVLNRSVEQAAIRASSAAFERMVAPGMLLGVECGNMYTASVWASLASLIFSRASALEGQRILVNSFGSGLAASMFCLQSRAVKGCYSLQHIAEQMDLEDRLSARIRRSPEAFTFALNGLEEQHEKGSYRPKASADDLLSGTFYLREVDSKFRRVYTRKP